MGDGVMGDGAGFDIPSVALMVTDFVRSCTFVLCLLCLATKEISITRLLIDIPCQTVSTVEGNDSCWSILWLRISLSFLIASKFKNNPFPFLFACFNGDVRDFYWQVHSFLFVSGHQKIKYGTIK